MAVTPGITANSSARTRLAVLPTPLTAAPRLAAALGISGPLLVKRDDLTGFAVAGNKARQLEFLLADAAAEGADVLVTGGSAGSNFVQAAAAAAAYAGIRCVVVIAGLGPDAGRRRAPHPNLAAASAWGAEIRWTGDADRASVDAALPVAAAHEESRGSRPYVVPRGGANAVGCEGYRLAFDELLTQLDEDRLDGARLDGARPTVVVAVGAGGTLAGLVAGAVARGRPFPIVGASVSRPPDEVGARVLGLAREVARAHGDERPGADDVRIVDARGEGHGIASAAGDTAAWAALRCAGLVLDPVYTAKAMAVVPAVVGDGPAVFWHTGGLLDAVDGMVAGSEVIGSRARERT